MRLWSNGNRRQRMKISYLPPSASSSAIMNSVCALHHKFHLFNIGMKAFKGLITGEKVKLTTSSATCGKTRVVFDSRSAFAHGDEKIN